MKHYLLTLISAFILVGSIQAQNDTIVTTTGLKYYYLHKSDGPIAKSGWIMITHYIGKFEDGSKFDSSRDREQPFVFGLNKGQVIKGMDEAVSLMHVGDRLMIIIPADLAYGEKGAGEVIPPNSTLVFDVELLDMRERSLYTALDETLHNKKEENDSTLHFKEMFKEYKKIAKSDFKDLYKDESDLNRLGYSVLDTNPKEAAKIFEMNVKLYPTSFNVYDSLGEAYMKLGKNDLAIKNYKKSLELNPENSNAVDMLKILE